MPASPQRAEAPGSAANFWMYWSGQTVSTLGSSFTTVVLPLQVFQLTHSAISLAVTVAVSVLPYLLLGLVIGAWVDRVDRKRLMILTDIARAAVIASVPVAAASGHLTVWWIYGVSFLTATLSIGFDAANFAAIPSLSGPDDLVRANSRIQASYSVARTVGPFVAGLLIALAPPARLLLLDAASFLVSSASLALVHTSFNAARPSQAGASIGQDVADGLRYVLRHPVLRSIVVLLLVINFFGPSVGAQLVYFAKETLGATDRQVGFLYAAASAGTVLFSLVSQRLARRWSLGSVALAGLALEGLAIVAFALVHVYWAALSLWALRGGADVLFLIGTYSLTQRMVPNELLGRVITFVRVLTWSTASVGAILGGLAIARMQTAVPVYATIGFTVFAAALISICTPLGRAGQYGAGEKGGE
jgi:MFS family permease